MTTEGTEPEDPTDVSIYIFLNCGATVFFIFFLFIIIFLVEPMTEGTEPKDLADVQ